MKKWLIFLKNGPLLSKVWYMLTCLNYSIDFCVSPNQVFKIICHLIILISCTSDSANWQLLWFWKLSFKNQCFLVKAGNQKQGRLPCWREDWMTQTLSAVRASSTQAAVVCQAWKVAELGMSPSSPKTHTPASQRVGVRTVIWILRKIVWCWGTVAG